jgi:CO/xanthine dehydrogenase FAD-binding subunit
MKPPIFEYDDPSVVEDAVGLLGRYGDECKVLAGGQSLVPLMNFRLARPARLIDLNRIDSLAGLSWDGGTLVIGAMTRHAHLEHSAEVAARCPLLTQAIGWVGHSQIRNRGTVGGSVAHADPAAELTAAFAALDARFHIRSHRGERVLGWREFFVGEFTTALKPDELLVSIEVPAQRPGTGTAFVEFARRHGDFALGGAAVTITVDGAGVCSGAAIALLAAGSVPVRPAAAEALLVGTVPGKESIQAAAGAAVAGVKPTADIHGGSEYRVGLLRVMAERALTQAAQRAGGAQ